MSSGLSTGSIGGAGPAPMLEAKSDMSPWTPLVLSLDGGGVRGLSSLYILRRIMRCIQELEDLEEGSEGESAQGQGERKLPLPCNYFDHIIGTSTGGLIAIMLGRLRMDVNECIQQYFIICNKIFRPHAYVGHYSRDRFEMAINDVISRYCRCHGAVCEFPRTHSLRQHDFLEFDDGGTPERTNGTCKVAVLVQRKAHGQGIDTSYLLRTYNHRHRPIHAQIHTNLNLGQVNDSTVKIWEACRATSAAPFFFRKIIIEGHWCIDGGVGDNNPSAHAWNEAKAMDHTNPPGRQKAAMLVSIGTGKTKPHTKFGGLLSLAQYARKAITETQQAHVTTRAFANLVDADYFRFDVRPKGEGSKGLADMKLDECKKTRKKREKNAAGAEGRRDAHGSGNASGTALNGHATTHNNESRHPASDPILAAMDVANDERAAQKVKGGYKPHKYDYPTFRRIKALTDGYCNSRNYSFGPDEHMEAQDVRSEIEKCARILCEYSRRRRAEDRARWERFRRHPDPNHESNIVAAESQA